MPLRYRVNKSTDSTPETLILEVTTVKGLAALEKYLRDMPGESYAYDVIIVWDADNDLEPTYKGYIIGLVSRPTGIQQLTYKTLVASKEKSNEYYDRRLNSKTFKTGDYVYLLVGPRPGKFGDHYTGPHKVLEILEKPNVRIQTKKLVRLYTPTNYAYPTLYREYVKMKRKMLAAWLIFYRLAVTLAQTQIILIDQTRELDFQIIGHVRDIMGHWRGEVVLPLNQFFQEPPELLTFRNLLSQLCTTLHPLCGLYDSEITKLRGLLDSTNRMQKEIKTILDNNKRRWQRSPAIIPDPFSDAHSYIAGSTMTITGSLERLMHDHPYGKFREIFFEGIQASLNASESFRDINFRLLDKLQAARKKQTSEN
ncbi:hypothetical protein QAD02_021109 [Eretmocerus hayati]|uniref:Uncharacterized protein n=1 Tax=Eretmocerus hayati TaxID=131215 RepID=A0ACC2PR74_9HYME|nr:hypothetical protein QAD02_021109 [Eretmocerus hayati]